MDPVAAALVLIVVAVAAWERRQHAISLQAERDSWKAERAELLNRIQRPDFLPRPRAERQDRGEQQDRPTDLAAYQKVGTVQPLRDTAEG